MAISPITGELVLLSEMAEHMRVSLIDPQWKTQREAMLSKIRETTQASDDEISRNLLDLAGHRPDVFGMCPLFSCSAVLEVLSTKEPEACAQALDAESHHCLPPLTCSAITDLPRLIRCSH